jgi:hypothetical protein
MELVKQTVVDQIEVKADGCVQVRVAISVTENENVIGRSFHRHVVVPGADYSGEDARVQAICAATHTAEVIAAYQAAIAAQGV